MKHYIDEKTQQAYGFEDSDDVNKLHAGLTRTATQRPSPYHDWVNGAWVLVRSAEKALDVIAAERNKRDMILARCDWTQMADSALSPTAKTAWATYRQALRDVTFQPNINSIKWPIKPSII